MRKLLLFAAAVAAALVAAPLSAQEPPAGVAFTLRRSFLEQLAGAGAHTVGARLTDTFRMGEHSKVHRVKKDCEMHIAAKPAQSLAVPGGLVIEPPNLCQGSRPPGIGTGLARDTAWFVYMDTHVKGKRCEVTGFPRIFTEHAAGGEAGSSNPDHVVELHPATAITCGSSRLDFVPRLRAYKDMAHITDNSAIACLSERKLFVRARGDPITAYDFAEEGARGTHGQCGNFVIVEAHVSQPNVRTLPGEDHVALAEVWVGDNGPYPVKLYTFAGTHVDSAVVKLLNGPDDETLETPVLGLVTYDYFRIVQAVQSAPDTAAARRGAPRDSVYKWLSAGQLADWKEVRAPLAIVVFGVPEQ